MIISDPDTHGEYQWGMRFESEIKWILLKHFRSNLVKTASDHLDTEQATDVVVGGGLPVPVSVRMRRHKWLQPYGGEFTIRMVSKRGQRSELEKITEGFGQYLFYGFADVAESTIQAWRIIDLDVFREHQFDVSRSVKTTSSGEHFQAFVVREFPPELVEAQAGCFDKAQLELPVRNVA